MRSEGRKVVEREAKVARAAKVEATEVVAPEEATEVTEVTEVEEMIVEKVVVAAAGEDPATGADEVSMGEAQDIGTEAHKFCDENSFDASSVVHTLPDVATATPSAMFDPVWRVAGECSLCIEVFSGVAMVTLLLTFLRYLA